MAKDDLSVRLEELRNKGHVETTNISKRKSLIGERFGMLTVLEYDQKRRDKDKVRKKDGEIKQIPDYWICICDCGNIKSVFSRSLIAGTTKSCGCIRYKTISKKRKLSFSKSFYEWCDENKCMSFIELWDYDLNKETPKDIGFGCSEKYYFKCPKGIHPSEKRKISDITYNNIFEYKCKSCHSIGYFLEINNMLRLWSDKNKDDPYDIKRKSTKNIYLICDNCGNERVVTAGGLKSNYLPCGCRDNISYPNKIMFNILTQLGIEFETEYSPEWAKDESGSQRRYDFYIPSEKLIIEMDGGLGHGRYNNMNKKTAEESKRIDDWKDFIANKNSIKVIRIDCEKSEIKYIKNNILESEIERHIDIHKISWRDVEAFAVSNMAKLVCDRWAALGNTTTTGVLAEELGLSKSTIVKYLKRGVSIGLCDYDPKQEMSIARRKYLLQKEAKQCQKTE